MRELWLKLASELIYPRYPLTCEKGVVMIVFTASPTAYQFSPSLPFSLITSCMVCELYCEVPKICNSPNLPFLWLSWGTHLLLSPHLLSHPLSPSPQHFPRQNTIKPSFIPSFLRRLPLLFCFQASLCFSTCRFLLQFLDDLSVVEAPKITSLCFLEISKSKPQTQFFGSGFLIFL